MEAYFSVLDKMTEQHISPEAKHNFGKGREGTWHNSHLSGIAMQPVCVRRTFKSS